MGKLLYITLILPVIICFVGQFALKSMFQNMVRKTVLVERGKHMEENEIAKQMINRKILCVGCSNGIGKGIAKGICQRGGEVIVVGRNMPQDLKSSCPINTFQFISADLSSLKTAKQLSKDISLKLSNIDTVIFTVGIVNGKERKETTEGLEMEVAVSYLSRFVMAQELINNKALKPTNSRKSRIFIMGFSGDQGTPQIEDFNWEKSWSGWDAHKNTVIGNDAIVLGLSQKHKDANFYGLNPGIIKTDLMFDFLGGKESIISQIQQFVIGHVCPSVEFYTEGTVMELLVSPKLENKSGSFYNQGGDEIEISKWLKEEGNLERIWKESEKLVKRALRTQ